MDFDIRNTGGEELEVEQKLRPLSFEDFKGQSKVVENLKVFVQAALMREKLWTMFCCTALRDLGRLHFQTSLHISSGLDLRSQADRFSTNPVILPEY